MDHISPESIGRFLTVADASEILNVSADEVRELIRSAELPAISVGSPGRWRIERRVLEEYIEQKYEETRRMSLWREANAASIQDISDGPKHRR
ncbi:helix-turn-helix domain-containing protein [Paramicrobacterium fandaimingii]|uniref:helix-turn-helix domain-containing protein n=1 Tax=Paramicrobacterium fandaimingii TaxID=2708079 RepID=UPI00141ED690|nr:helix-turn-helix domain-containing protein [Microbacterium fandaimingii]